MTICLAPQVTSHVPSQPLPPSNVRQRLASPHRQVNQDGQVTRHNTYALRIRGDRLQASQLFDGDLLIIHRHQHDTQQETATLTINDHQFPLKHLSITRLGVHLCPEDAAMPALFLHNGDIQVLGMVMGVAHHTRQTRHH